MKSKFVPVIFWSALSMALFLTIPESAFGQTQVSSVTILDSATNQRGTLAMSGQNTWVLTSSEGRFVFKEVSRNKNRIEMFDQSRNLALRINVSSKAVRFGNAKKDGTLGSQIQGSYRIVGANQNPGGKGSGGDAGNMNRPGNTGNNARPPQGGSRPPTGNTNRPATGNKGNSKGVGNQANSPFAALETAIFNETNKMRRKNNLPAFKNSVPAANLSRQHSQTMTRTGLSHDGMQQRIAESKRQMGMPAQPGQPSGGGENVIEGFDKGSVQANAADLVDRWMKSPGHRRNILDPNSTHLGVGVAQGNDRFYATQLFLY